jgi:hypothetical protein
MSVCAKGVDKNSLQQISCYVGLLWSTESIYPVPYCRVFKSNPRNRHDWDIPLDSEVPHQTIIICLLEMRDFIFGVNLSIASSSFLLHPKKTNQEEASVEIS